MQQVNDFFYQIAEQASDGYFIFDVETGNFQYLNEALCRMWDVRAEDISINPVSLLEYIHPDDQFLVECCYHEVIADLNPKTYEFRLLTADQYEKHIRIKITPVKEKDKLLLCGTLEDITVERHNRIHIEQINARKNIALEVLAHDLKEPFGMMKLAASSMVNGIKKFEDSYLSEGLAFIIEMCERNMRMVKSLINKEFLKSAEVEIKKDRTDIIWELRDLIRFYKRSRLRDQKQFSFKTASDKIYVRWDSMKFLQVLNNLISNAIKFTSDQGRIALTAEDKGETALITLADDGVGIPTEIRDSLFDRAEQGLKPGLLGEDSHGLGMGIIKAIVDLHGGKIWFETELGKGTIFYIELPK